MPVNVAKIKKRREELKLSQGDAAEKAGLRSRQHWNKIEAGGFANFTIETLDKIAGALGIDARELLTPAPKGKKKG